MARSQKYKEFKDTQEEAVASASGTELQNALEDEWIDSDKDDDEEDEEDTTKNDEEAQTDAVSGIALSDAEQKQVTSDQHRMEDQQMMDDQDYSIGHKPPSAFKGILLLILLAGSAAVFMAAALSPSLMLTPSPPSPPPLMPSPSPPPWERFWMHPQPPPSPSPPPPPPGPLNSRQVVRTLNKRFKNSKPSNVLADAGVLLHTFDAPDASGREGGRKDVWNPCPSDMWCGRYADRMSASVVTPRIRSFFWAAMGETSITKAMGGFVLDSQALEPANSSIFCGWGADAGTMGMLCEPMGLAPDRSCIPGCRSGFECGSSNQLGSYCWWPPHKLKQLLELHEAQPRKTDHSCHQFDCKCVVCCSQTLP